MNEDPYHMQNCTAVLAHHLMAVASIQSARIQTKFDKVFVCSILGLSNPTLFPCLAEPSYSLSS
jgi:hypothetical protein